MESAARLPVVHKVLLIIILVALQLEGIHQDRVYFVYIATYLHCLKSPLSLSSEKYLSSICAISSLVMLMSSGCYTLSIKLGMYGIQWVPCIILNDAEIGGMKLRQLNNNQFLYSYRERGREGES